MFLLVCVVEKELMKYELTDMIQDNKFVENAFWLNGENAKEVEDVDVPFTIGSMASLFRNKKQDVLLAKIKGKNNLDNILKLFKNYKSNLDKLDYFVVQLVA